MAQWPPSWVRYCLGLIANNLNSTTAKNQIMARMAQTKIKKKVVSPVECGKRTSDDKLNGRHAARQPLR